MISFLARALFVLLLSVSLAPAAYGANINGGSPSPTGGTNINGGSPSSGIGLVNPLNIQCSNGTSCLLNFVTGILNIVVEIGSILLVFMIVYVGFKFVLAQGAPEEVRGARRMLMWTIIGGLILLGAKGIALGIAATVQALSNGP
jgi:hypothetical protein